MGLKLMRMTQIVSITSQGQISIPANIRRNLKLNLYNKASIRQEKGRLIIEPVEDILLLAGSLKGYALKGKNPDEISRLEKKAWEKAAVSRYKKSIK